MRYITLTDKCVNFEFSTNSKDIKLVWNVPHDFSEIPFIGIHSFHLSELEIKKLIQYTKFQQWLNFNDDPTLTELLDIDISQ